MLILITLPVYTENEDTSQAEIIGRQTTDDMYGIADMYFYRVDAIMPIDGTKCVVHCGGSEFMVALSADQVKGLVNQSIAVNNPTPPRFEYHLN